MTLGGGTSGGTIEDSQGKQPYSKEQDHRDGIIWMKNGGVESVREVWELVSVSDVLGESVLMKEELFPPEF